MTDLWNNEIVSHALLAKRVDRMTYISGLKDLLELKKAHPEYKMILNSDQGSVYASKAYNELLPMPITSAYAYVCESIHVTRWNAYGQRCNGIH